MPAHWTYTDYDRTSDLEQGDILTPSLEVRALFEQYHKHFCSEKYLGFMVASQTCDLVCRKGRPKTGYITLAAIRPLSQVLQKLASHVIQPFAPGRYPTGGRDEVKRLLERILNQNEQSIGLFFLYPDADISIGEPAVAMLRVTVAFRSEHYDVFRQARVGRLAPEFQAKLGWLLGNLFNRPATPDWIDQEGGKDRFERLIRECLTQQQGDTPQNRMEWIDDQLVEEARKQGADLGAIAVDAFEQFRPKPPLERALDEIAAELTRVIPGVDAAQVTKLQNRLKNSRKFSKLFPR